MRGSSRFVHGLQDVVLRQGQLAHAHPQRIEQGVAQGSGNRFLLDQALARVDHKPDWFCEVRHVPALVLNARNDPFVPEDSLPRPEAVGDWVTCWQPAGGGHVGFPRGMPPGDVRAMPEAVTAWLAQRL